MSYPEKQIRNFWKKVDTTGGPDSCWPWLGGRKKKGYGCFFFDGSAKASHRFAYAITFEHPRKLHVLHSCDNPPCNNPKHLFLGTNQDNVNDKMTKGRHVTSGNFKITDTEVLQIRQLRQSGESLRVIGEKFGVHLQTVFRICAKTRRKAVS